MHLACTLLIEFQQEMLLNNWPQFLKITFQGWNMASAASQLYSSYCLGSQTGIGQVKSSIASLVSHLWMGFLRVRMATMASESLCVWVGVRVLSGPVLRDTARLSQRYPPIARYGFFGVSTLPIGCDTPSPFSEHFPLGEHVKWRCDTPPRKTGISAILARYPMKTRQMGAIPPSAILSRKGIAR